MREVIRVFGIASSLFVLSFVGIAVAQKGLAPNGYYPYGYGGLTFTGEVVEIDEQNQNLTLAFTKNDKTEKFIGHLLAPCGVNSKPKPKTSQSRVCRLARYSQLITTKLPRKSTVTK